MCRRVMVHTPSPVFSRSHSHTPMTAVALRSPTWGRGPSEKALVQVEPGECPHRPAADAGCGFQARPAFPFHSPQDPTRGAAGTFPQTTRLPIPNSTPAK